MTLIQASEFKAKGLALMDQVARTDEAIVVTKNGRPIAELRPYRAPRAKSLIGLQAGRIAIHGDIVAPLAGERFEQPRVLRARPAHRDDEGGLHGRGATRNDAMSR